MISIARSARFWALITIIAATLLAATAKAVTEPVSAEPATPVEIAIPEGSSSGEIASILQKEGLISSSLGFKAYVKITGRDGALKFGRYDISPSESLEEIVSKLEAGFQKGIVLKIPEGYTARQVAAKAASLRLVDYEEFMALAVEPTDELKSAIPFAMGGGLEGYLFPDTYEFSEGAGAEAVIKVMLNNFAEKMGGRVATELKLGLTPSQVITLASIVEKEALLSEELAVVAGVFYNRLDRNMALQSCATVQYLLPEPKPVLSREDTLIESPYNTYPVNGLPPGPICNPGEAAIQAVLMPSKHDYLFFVAKGDGSHVFSRTYSEHLRAIAQY